MKIKSTTHVTAKEDLR